MASRQPTRASRALYDHLVRIGLRAIVSQPTAAFALDRMLCAYLAPLVAALDRGSSVDTIDATLRAFGFCRRAPALLSRVDTMALAEHLAGDRGVAATRAALGRLARTPRGSGRGQARIQRALLLSLLDAARALLADGTLAHPTMVDVVARELLDFPLCHGGMCALLTRARVAELLSAQRTLRDLLDDGVLARAEEYTRGNADFYL
jgi:3-hydroxyacyl-CoA dehydrogenase